MNRVLSKQDTAVTRATQGLTAFSATSLVGSIQKVTREVLSRGAAIITKHDEPVMVLLSLERYMTLEKAAVPNLDALSEQFDHMYARMQAPGVADKTIDALSMTPKHLGKAAQRAASPRRATK